MAEKPEDDVEVKSKPEEDDSKTDLDDSEGIYAFFRFLIVTYFRKSMHTRVILSRSHSW